MSWSDEEDLILLKEYMQNSGKWSLISQKLSGRNCYCVKNRFESLCRKFNVKKESDSLSKEVETMYQTIYEAQKHQKNEKEEQSTPKKQIPLQMGTNIPQNPIIMNPCTFFTFIYISYVMDSLLVFFTMNPYLNYQNVAQQPRTSLVYFNNVGINNFGFLML